MAFSGGTSGQHGSRTGDMVSQEDPILRSGQNSVGSRSPAEEIAGGDTQLHSNPSAGGISAPSSVATNLHSVAAGVQGQSPNGTGTIVGGSHDPDDTIPEVDDGQPAGVGVGVSKESTEIVSRGEPISKSQSSPANPNGGRGGNGGGGGGQTATGQNGDSGSPSNFQQHSSQFQSEFGTSQYSFSNPNYTVSYRKARDGRGAGLRSQSAKCARARLQKPVQAFRRVQAIEEALYKSWMAARRLKLTNPRELYGKEDEVVKKTAAPSSMRDGRFSFWQDIRPPFTVTGVGPIDDQDPEWVEVEKEGIPRPKLPELADVSSVQQDSARV